MVPRDEMGAQEPLLGEIPQENEEDPCTAAAFGWVPNVKSSIFYIQACEC